MVAADHDNYLVCISYFYILFATNYGLHGTEVLLLFDFHSQNNF